MYFSAYILVEKNGANVYNIYYCKLGTFLCGDEARFVFKVDFDNCRDNFRNKYLFLLVVNFKEI